MARNMSFFLTTDQIRNRTKTVTRRLGWKFLQPGDILNACVKCQGLKKGQRIEKLCQIRVISTRLEALARCTDDDAAREGFPGMTGLEFAQMFCKHMGGDGRQFVNRIEFEYVDA